MVKNMPPVKETWFRSLGQEDPLEKEIATHSSVLAGRIQFTEEPRGLQSMGLQRVGYDWATNTFSTLIKHLPWNSSSVFRLLLFPPSLSQSRFWPTCMAFCLMSFEDLCFQLSLSKTKSQIFALKSSMARVDLFLLFFKSSKSGVGRL